MELKEWQNGLRLCMENIIDLFIDANILMNQNKWSRGCFLFITAYEELATAFYILGNFNTPKPEELKELLWHSKKMAVSSFLTFPATGNVKILQEYFKKYIKIDFDKFDLSTDNIYKKEWYKFGDQIQREESFSYWRNLFLYLSFSPGKSTFLSPRTISKAVKARIALELYNRLSIAIPIMQVLILKLLASKTKEIDIQKELFKGADMELFERITLIFEFDKILTTRSIEKIRSFDKVSKKLKDLAVMYISDPSKIKDDQFRIDLIKEFFKDLAPKFQKLWEDENKKNDIEVFVEFVSKVNPKMAENIKKFFIVLSKIAKDDFTPDDLHKYFKNPRKKSKIKD